MKQSLILFLFIVCASVVLAQDSVAKYTLKFDIKGDPGISEVGFDNPKNCWKMRYWIVLTDDETLLEIGTRFANDRRGEDRIYKGKCKGFSPCIFIKKGKFKRKDLGESGNREVRIDITLSEDARQLISTAQKPSFLVTVESEIRSLDNNGIAGRKPGYRKHKNGPNSFQIRLDAIPNRIFGAYNEINKKETGEFWFGIYPQGE